MATHKTIPLHPNKKSLLPVETAVTDPGKKLSALEPALPEKGARHRGWAALRRALSRAPVNAIRPSVPAFSSPAEATTSSCRSPKCFRAFSPSTPFPSTP